MAKMESMSVVFPAELEDYPGSLILPSALYRWLSGGPRSSALIVLSLVDPMFLILGHKL